MASKARVQDGVPLVLIAGGGVAGLEAMLALRHMAGDRLAVTIVAPVRDFSYRPFAVGEPFGVSEVKRFDLARLASERGARYRADAVSAVHPGERAVRTGGGAWLDYDALVIASGARAREALPGALTFWGSADGDAVRLMLADACEGRACELVFALPSEGSWPLPLYELALLTARHLRANGDPGARLTIVSPEQSPLGVFGARASDGVRALLEANRIDVRCGTHPVAVEAGALAVAPGGSIKADRVVTLPRLEGPYLPGVPCDDRGFIPADANGQVRGLDDVFAAGDVTTFPIKQGGLAAQQADAVAEVLAARAGAPVTPRPFRPVLRGLLLTGERPSYLRAEVSGGRGEASAAASHPLWWPPGKIAGKHLAPFLAARAKGLAQPPPPSGAEPISVEVPLAPAEAGAA